VSIYSKLKNFSKVDSLCTIGNLIVFSVNENLYFVDTETFDVTLAPTKLILKKGELVECRVAFFENNNLLVVLQVES
jgi:hypothetical protein